MIEHRNKFTLKDRLAKRFNNQILLKCVSFFESLNWGRRQEITLYFNNFYLQQKKAAFEFYGDDREC